LQVYLTIDLQEAKQPQISLDNDDAGGKVTFRSAAQSHATGQEDHDYALDVRSLQICRAMMHSQRLSSSAGMHPGG
jgi:hypothetical protein